MQALQPDSSLLTDRYWDDAETAVSRRRILMWQMLWLCLKNSSQCIYNSDIIMGTISSLITSLTSVYSTVHSGADQRKHQSSASLAFVRGIHRRPVNSPHKWPVTRKCFHLMKSSCLIDEYYFLWTMALNLDFYIWKKWKIKNGRFC